MMKPDWCDQQTWENAAARVGRHHRWIGPTEVTQLVARAILDARREENEACAKVADEGFWTIKKTSQFGTSEAVWKGLNGPEIAAAIRARMEVKS